MESVSEVATAEESPASVVQRGELPLGADRRESEDGMIIGCGVEDALRINQVGAVERDEVVALFGNALERIHPIVRGGSLVAAGRLIDPEVPGGPGKPSSGHHRGIGVQEGFVALVAEWGEKASLLFRCVAEHGEALVCVSRKHDRIKPVPAARCRGDPGA